MRSLAYAQNASLGSAVGIGKGLNNIATAAVVAAGSAYKVNDLVDVDSGTAIIKCTVRVTAIDSSGGVTAIEFVYIGVYTTNPNATSATLKRTGVGSGMTLALTFNTDAIPDGASFVTIGAEAQDLRWRDDGVDPTGNVGNIIKVGTPLTYRGRMGSFKLIEDAAGGVANIDFYRQ